MSKFFSILFTFYKPALIPSLAFSILVLAFGIQPIVIIFMKLILCLFFWYLLNETKYKSSFIFYQNLGHKPWVLIAGSYILDCIIFLTICLIANLL